MSQPSQKPTAAKSRKRSLQAVPPTPPAPVGRVGLDEAIEQLSPEFLACRDYGHSWKPYTATWNAAGQYYVAQLKCQRCKTLRTRFIGPHGELAGGKYEYADGYTVSGLGRLTGSDRDHVRLASVRNLLPRTVEDGR